jgi:eukaryotic-like serine/threonine-protein kinase
MTLTPGSRLGPYEILSPLGAGGMGEVYRARDARLGREVAVKVLPGEISADRRRLGRFEKEARAASSLNHPNIVTIYDIGSSESVSFIAMELVEGKTLRELLVSGPVALRRLLSLAAQIADGLARAHAAGIVHRDLKPENLMVTKDGFVKILDFGLAKLLPAGFESSEGTDLPTMTRGTEPGTVMGTVGYMSPEQASGHPVDFHSDQFSVGSLLYEMATGKRAFARGTTAQTLAAIIQEEPEPIAVINPQTPAPLRWIVERCHAKEPEGRYASTEDLKRELASVRDHLSEIALGEGSLSEPRHQRSRRREKIAWTLAAVFALGLALILSLPHPALHLARFQASLLPPAGTAFNWIASQALSPDGQYIVFSAADNETPFLWLRSLVRGQAQKLPGTEGGAYPFWSPDSRSIGFFTFENGKLKRVEIAGSLLPQVLCDVSEARGGSWGADNVVLFSTLNGPLRRVPATGGNPSTVTHLDSSRRELDHRWPYFLPDGRRFLYLIRTEGESRSMTLAAGSLNSLEVRILGKVDSNVAYAPPGYILSRTIDHSLIAQPFDTRSLRLFGSPYSVAERTAVVPGRWVAPFSVSRAGVLAYMEAQEAEPRRLQWFDRSGKTVGSFGPSGRLFQISLAPDGARVAMSVFDAQAEGLDLWLYDLARGTNTRLTFDPGADRSPVWSPDGSQVVFSGNRKGFGNLYLKQANGAKVEELLLDTGGESDPTDWSSDGHFVLYEDRPPNGKWSLWALPMTGERKPIPVKQSQFNEAEGKFSPDGHWIAYTSDETGRTEVCLTSFPAADKHWQVSALGGQGPRWSRDGRELFYASTSSDPQLTVVEVKTQPSFSASAPQSLFRFPSGSTYDIAPDGKRFLVNALPEVTRPPSLTVVFDWLPEKRR